MEQFDGPVPDLTQMRDRIQQKKTDAARYNFSRAENDLLRTFFDLAQEFDTLQDFFRICVTMPLEFLGLESNLFVIDEVDGHLNLICSSLTGINAGSELPSPHIRLTDVPYETEGSYVLPIRRKLTDAKETALSPNESSLVLGMFEVFPLERLSQDDRFFLLKYANRIGFNLHNRLIARQNVHHLKFINNLVRDIEHNVLIPNIYFKHLFNRLKKKIGELECLGNRLQSFRKSCDTVNKDCNELLFDINALHKDFMRLHHDLLNHHASYTLSLESLLRRDHFSKGHFVLRPKACYVEKEIIAPQLDYYRGRFESRGIIIEQPQDMMEEEFPIMVDVGLLAQVYDNLFSNAAKYAEAFVDHAGQSKKTMAYGREVLADYFGPGQAGVKFNVYTTGPHLSETEVTKIFFDGYRGENVQQQPGTGHGLAFVKQVVEIHGGRVGCEATPEGNNFYFILPLTSPEKGKGER
ncbi:MAG: hypothetical protein AUK28_04345 [Desulfobacterales bacterium CG2_30_60_27]|nr:MAG: hypothetical protein AUK28_04345 [Desulfobacterales bacterium CG2_30_60_27]